MALAGPDKSRDGETHAPRRKIKLGLVGCGNRGSWISRHFLKHGGYEFRAVADYFPDVSDKVGASLGVDKSRRFSGLSGYEKVLESGVDAVVLKTPPGFFPEHASAAVDAGVHVYMAKPVAVDVPGCTRIRAAGKRASQENQVFFVDYQVPTEPINIEVVGRIREEGYGKIIKIATTGVSGGHDDPPKTATIESRLAKSVWGNDTALGGGWITVYDIHAIDVVLWVLGRSPLAAFGYGSIRRPHPHGDAHDTCSVLYEYPNGLIHEHSGIALPTGADGVLDCQVLGSGFNASVAYWHPSHFRRRGGKKIQGPVDNLYTMGVVRNIAAFYRDVTGGRFENPTVARAVDGCLACILGREATSHGGRLTMDELLKENRSVELDLTGLTI